MGNINLGSYPILYKTSATINNHLQSLFQFISSVYELFIMMAKTKCWKISILSPSAVGRELVAEQRN